jgi:hypothetical protein
MHCAQPSWAAISKTSDIKLGRAPPQSLRSLMRCPRLLIRKQQDDGANAEAHSYESRPGSWTPQISNNLSGSQEHKPQREQYVDHRLPESAGWSGANLVHLLSAGRQVNY